MDAKRTCLAVNPCLTWHSGHTIPIPAMFVSTPTPTKATCRVSRVPRALRHWYSMGRVEPNGLEGLGSIMCIDTLLATQLDRWVGLCGGYVLYSPGRSLSLAPLSLLLPHVVPTYLILYWLRRVYPKVLGYRERGEWCEPV